MSSSVSSISASVAWATRRRAHASSSAAGGAAGRPDGDRSPSARGTGGGLLDGPRARGGRGGGTEARAAGIARTEEITAPGSSAESGLGSGSDSSAGEAGTFPADAGNGGPLRTSPIRGGTDGTRNELLIEKNSFPTPWAARSSSSNAQRDPPSTNLEASYREEEKGGASCRRKNVASRTDSSRPHPVDPSTSGWRGERPGESRAHSSGRD
jgi:hypothetical protein